MDSFFDEVYKVVRQIPLGKVASYGQIAAMLGNPRSARVVGWAMNSCPDDLPWQRVVKSDGSLAGRESYEIQKVILLSEGIVFHPNGKIDMKKCLWLA